MNSLFWFHVESWELFHQCNGTGCVLRQDIGVFEGKIIEAAQVLILITVVVVSCLARSAKRAGPCAATTVIQAGDLW